MKKIIKKNKSIYKICIIIIDDLSGGFYKIKIVGNYDFIFLLDKETYVVKYNMLIKCEDYIWEELKSYNSSNNPLFGNDEDKINS